MSEEKFKFPSEEVELPSKGLIYPKENPLSSGKIEMKYMTAKEEDILTSQSLLEKQDCFLCGAAHLLYSFLPLFLKLKNAWE